MNCPATIRRVLMTVLSFGILGILAGEVLSQDVPKEDPWASMRFLLGEWVGDGGGVPGQGTGGTTFDYDLQKTVLVRKNFSDFPATHERPAFRHEDLMIISMQNGRPSAMYYDNEGHVIRYEIIAVTDTVTFLSESSSSSSRFRLTYVRQSDDALRLFFDVAPPDAPEKFFRYVESSVRRKR